MKNYVIIVCFIKSLILGTSRKQSVEQSYLAIPEEDKDECSDNDELKSLTNADSSSEGADEYETCDSGVSERSSLSEETSERINLTKQLERHLFAKMNHGNKMTLCQKNRKFHVKYNSIISEIFDGKLLSSVQCLTCDRVSKYKFLPVIILLLLLNLH